VDVREAVPVVRRSVYRVEEGAYSVNRDTSPCCGGIVLVAVQWPWQRAMCAGFQDIWWPQSVGIDAAKSEQSHCQQE
jgi:hypothetical protein